MSDKYELVVESSTGALEPEPVVPVPTKYQAGPTEVLGHAPGETFTATLDLVQEARLIGGGAISKVVADTKTKQNPSVRPSGPTKHKE